MTVEDATSSTSASESVSIQFSGPRESDFPQVRAVRQVLDLRPDPDQEANAGSFWGKNERPDAPSLTTTTDGTEGRRHMRVDVPISVLPVAFSVGQQLYIVHERSVHTVIVDSTRRYVSQRSTSHEGMTSLQVDPFDDTRDVEVNISRR